MKNEGSRYFGPLEREHIFLIRKWRNKQSDILRNQKRISHQEQLNWFEGLRKDKCQRLFAIFEDGPAKRKLIGYCGLTHIDRSNRHAEVSFLVDTKRTERPAVYRKDMLSTLAFLTRYAFLELKFKKIFTETYAFRKRHIKILEEFGFKKEGVLRSQLLLREKFHDSLMHSILRHEFFKRGRQMNELE